MDKLSAEDLDFITELFRVDEKEARKVIDGKSFYNPLTNKLEDKSALVAGNYVALSDDIQNWINKEENRIRYFPGYDGIEPFIAFAKDTVEMIKTHQIDEEKRKSEEMKSTKASNAPAVLKQFDEMKAKHPDAIFLFWAPRKRLNKVNITKLSRFLLFLRAYYVQKVCTQLGDWLILLRNSRSSLCPS